LRDDEGGTTAVIEISRDITENRKNEEELRRSRETLEERIRERTAELTRALKELAKSEETYRSLVRMSPDGVTFVDVTGKVTYTSLQTARIHGYDDPEELVGRDGFELVAPEDRERAAGFLRRALEEGGVRSIEFVMLRKDGSRFHAEMNAVLLRGGEGKPSGFIATTRDVTERKRAEDELRRTLAQNQALLAAVPDLMFIINKEGTYVDFKQTDPGMLALPPEEIIGKGIRETGLSPDATEVVISRLEEALRTGAVTTAEYELPMPQGPGVYEVRFAKISEDEVLSVVRDITERKEAEVALRRARDELEARVRERTAALEQSNEELRSFTYLVSHDLRAPLVNLQGFAAELRESLESVRDATKAAVPHLDDGNRKALATALGQDVPEALSFIEASAKRMDGYINGVLKLSRLGRRELEFETLDMKALVGETLKTLHHQLEARGAKAEVADLPEVAADRTAMEQIVGNLLTNAVCYLQPGRPGVIEVTGERASGVAAVHVRDNGRGIARNDLKKVFEPFARVGEMSTPGEGMGLAYVQTLVRRHGGRIWCESEPGVGTTFTFTIPEQRTEGGNYA
jgi:PAS domain S-box-containing protein